MALQRILVPVDYSSCSRAALALAVELGQRLGAQLDVVHVWDRPSYVTDVVMAAQDPVPSHSLIRMIQENAERDLAEFLQSSGLPRDITGSGRLLAGDPASALLHDLKERACDLVVVGTHGRTGLSHVVLGSVAEKLARLSPVPVLVVPADRAQNLRG